ncbi:MAG: immunoglobulin domain-containing protein [Planctomycetes bacterium]|nr:immunoglobulin domain-containing protein [Planctomycetota bacterium]
MIGFLIRAALRPATELLRSPSPTHAAVRPAYAALLAIILVFTSAARAQCVGGWIPGIGTQGTNGTIYALAVHTSGDVIAGGSFTTAGGLPASNIARYNPTTGVWSPIGAGVSGNVRAIVVLPDGDLVVGGNITSAGSTPVNNIARCNPTTGAWSALGAGLTGGTGPIVYTLLGLSNGDVIVGGVFSLAGAVAVNNIARLNPTTGAWFALGSGVTGAAPPAPSTVAALALSQTGEVYVGGNFTTAGGIAASNIARYSPATNSWSALGTGVSNIVTALTLIPGGDLFAGGNFNSAGGGAAIRVARYNPASNNWSPLGSGLNGTVWSMVTLPGGDLIIGGQFSFSGSLPLSRIARYAPGTSAWSALQSGISGNTVNALVVLPGGDLIAGGDFTATSAASASRAARYYFGPRPPVIGVQPLPVVTAPTGSATFTITATGGPGTLSYQWRRDGVPISTIENATAATPTLLLTNVQASDLGVYDCVVSTACPGGSTTSSPATLGFVQSCPADFNQDGGIDGADVSDFFAAWEAGGCG